MQCCYIGHIFKSEKFICMTCMLEKLIKHFYSFQRNKKTMFEITKGIKQRI